MGYLKRHSFFILLVLFSGVLFMVPLLGQAAYGDAATFVGKIYDGDGGQALNAYFDFPEDITVDNSGNFYLADTYNNVVRKIAANGKVSTVAGSGSYGDKTGSASQAEFALLKGVAVDDSGNCPA